MSKPQPHIIAFTTSDNSQKVITVLNEVWDKLPPDEQEFVVRKFISWFNKNTASEMECKMQYSPYRCKHEWDVEIFSLNGHDGYEYCKKCKSLR